jgi:hypothetical protein
MGLRLGSLVDIRNCLRGGDAKTPRRTSEEKWWHGFEWTGVNRLLKIMELTNAYPTSSSLLFIFNITLWYGECVWSRRISFLARDSL